MPRSYRGATRVWLAYAALEPDFVELGTKSDSLWVHMGPDDHVGIEMWRERGVLHLRTGEDQRVKVNGKEVQSDAG